MLDVYFLSTFENIINATDRKIVNVAVKNSQESYEIKSESKDDKQVYILSDQDESKTSQSNASVLFDTLINLKPTQIIEGAEDLSTYGLTESNAELTITFENNEKIMLFLGDDALWPPNKLHTPHCAVLPSILAAEYSL